jgi:hypothetical protein
MSGNISVQAPSLADVRAGTAQLQTGQRGDPVARVQLLLGVFDDGAFGQRTRNAVIAFQQAQGIEVPAGDEGKVGSATLAALERANETTLASLAKIDGRNKTTHTHPALRRGLADLAEALEEREMRALITGGFRTFAEQELLFNQGRTSSGPVVTNARGGLSNHNYGLAVDIYPVINGGVLTDVPANESQAKLFTAIQRAIIEESENLGLFPGARFTSFVDPPHVQLHAENVLRATRCLDIFRANNNSFDAVWAEATRQL